jgi:UDP-glucose 4-epimerase
LKTLVTGAAGFIGTALSNRLIQQGDQVVGLDNLFTGSPDGLLPEVELIQGDINDRELLWKILQGVDCVFHLAAKAIVPNSILYPREYEEVNVGGTVTLLEAMRDVGISRMVFASSGAIYGLQSRQPLKEKMTKPKPASPYAVSKLASEYYINTIGRLWGLEAVCLRIFNAYGPRQNFSFAHAPVIPTFLRLAASQGTVVVHGDGHHTRDFVYIDDVIDALISASKLNDCRELVINVGSGIETSVTDVLELARKITGGSPEVVYNPRRPGGPDRMRADLTLANQILNFYPKTSFEEGMAKTFELDRRLHKNSASINHK